MIFLYWLIIIIVIFFVFNNAVQNKLFLKNDADNFVSEEVITQEGKTVVQKYEYDSLGQVTQMTVCDKNKKKELASYAYSYDLAGNKLTSTETINGKEQTTGFTYDDNNRLLSMKNDDQTIKYEYDKNGNRVKQSGTDEVLDYIYDTGNRLLAVKDNKGLLMAALYDGDDNRVFTASRTEDTTAYQLFKRQEKKGKGASKSTSTTRSGQDSRKSPKTSPNGEENSLFWYGFTENVIQGLSSLPETVGNLWMNVFDTVSRAYHQKITKDRANEEGIVVNPPSLGNRPGEGEVTYSSEVNEVLIPYTTREDTYNYYEVRNYVNDVNQENTQVLQTYDDEMKSRETYTYGNERLSYTNEKTKDEYQYLTDARGSVTGMMKDGELDSSNSYSVFGTPEEVDETGNPFGYTGEAQDVTGYNYLRARYYDSQSGTFLTQDSYEGEEDNPLSQNGYTYVENNPINYSDPTGHKKSMFSGAINAMKKVANSFKQVANSIYNGARIAASTSIYNGARIAANTIYNVRQATSSIYNGAKIVANTMSKVTQTANSIYKGASIAGASAIARQMAVQTAFVGIAYKKATGNKGSKKIKEAENLVKNWNKAMKETLAKFCTTAPKAKKNKSVREQQEENLKKAFGEPKNGKYYVPSVTGSGQGRWLSIEDAYRMVENGRKTNWTGVGVSVTVLAVLLFGPGALASMGIGTGGTVIIGSGGTATVVQGLTEKEIITSLVASGAISTGIAKALMSLSGNSSDEYKTPKKINGKPKNNIPDRFRGERPKKGESGKQAAKRILQERGEYDPKDTGPGSDFNKLKKYFDTHF